MSNSACLMVYYSQIVHLTFGCNRNVFLVVGEQEGTGGTRNATREVSGGSVFTVEGLCQADKEGTGSPALRTAHIF